MHDSNNVGQSTAPIDVSRTPSADLQATSLTAVAKGIAGRSLNVAWTVGNVGEGTTGDGIPGGMISDWSDRLVLSGNRLRGDADDTLLGTFARSGGLAAGAEYTRSVTVSLPAGIEGDYFLYLHADIDDKVYEESREANNPSAFRPIRIDLPRPDLLVTSLNAPASALNGSDVQLSWRVENLGTLATGVANWNDRIVLSRDAVRDAGDVVLKTVAHSGALDEGAGYDAQATVTIPTGYSMSEGEYFLFVDTEAGKVISEMVESNNATSSAIQLAFPPKVVFWDGGGDGASWSDARNWTRDTLPGADDTVTIDAPMNLTVVHQAGDETVRRLILADNLHLTGGSLTAVEGITLNATLTLAGSASGTTLRGTVSGTGSIAVAEQAGGTLDAVTLNAVPMTIRGHLRVTNGLTLNGATTTLLADGTGSDRLLEFVGTQTLGGSGEVVFSGSVSRNLVLANGGTLTIGPGVTIRGAAGIVGQDPGASGVDSQLVVQGRIVADTGGQEIVVNASSLTNLGTLAAASGGTLRVTGLAPNSGVLDAGAGGVICVDGDFTNTAFGTVRVAVLGDQAAQYGRVEVGGTAHLGGTFGLSLGKGVLPEVAWQLEPLSYRTHVGAFAEVTGLNVSAGSNGVVRGNAGVTPGVVGQAFVFDGNADGVFVGNSTSLQLQDFTIEAWVRRQDPTKISRDVGETTAEVFAYGHGGYGLGLWDDGRLFLSRIGISHTTTVTLRVTDSIYHHIAVSKAGSTVTFYVDGIAEAAAAYDPGFTFGTGAAIGARGDNLRGSLLGNLDEVSVYQRVLSATEIRTIYDAQHRPRGNPDQQPLPHFEQQDE